MMMKYRNNLSIGFFSRRGIGILCDCALSTNICLNIHHGSALAFQIIENFGQMPDRELHNSAASNAEGTRGWRAATWPLLEEGGGTLGKLWTSGRRWARSIDRGDSHERALLYLLWTKQHAWYNKYGRAVHSVQERAASTENGVILRQSEWPGESGWKRLKEALLLNLSKHGQWNDV